MLRSQKGRERKESRSKCEAQSAEQIESYNWVKKKVENFNMFKSKHLESLSTKLPNMKKIDNKKRGNGTSKSNRSLESETEAKNPNRFQKIPVQ
uniref:Uncharacterized protein n=1 Tax=Megaselia scalaris TaxID=36166 RepID=T1H3F3_MEGSC